MHQEELDMLEEQLCIEKAVTQQYKEQLTLHYQENLLLDGIVL